MIYFQLGDILRSDAEAIVNPVNCVGVMGKGLALQFRNRFPDNYDEYRKVCDLNLLKPATMFVFDLGRLTNPQYIVNFPTKIHWLDRSRIEYIESGLKSLVEEIKRLDIRSIAVPPLGCGLGGLKWRPVRMLIKSMLNSDTLPNTTVFVYEPTR